MKKMDSLWHVECGLEATHYCGKHAKFYLHKMEQKQKSNWINRSEMKFRMNGLKFGVAFYRSSLFFFYFSTRETAKPSGPEIWSTPKRADNLSQYRFSLQVEWQARDAGRSNQDFSIPRNHKIESHVSKSWTGLLSRTSRVSKWHIVGTTRTRLDLDYCWYQPL